MDWELVLAWAATLSSIACQLVGIEICLRIVRKGGTGDTSPVPFFAFFVSACIWLKYSIMRSIYSMIMSNCLGAMLQFLYICIFYIYTVKRGHMHRLISMSLCLLFGPLIYIRYYQPDDNMAAGQLGLYGCFFTVICYASPLATVAQVLKSKSCDSISAPLCVLNFVAAVGWYSYGQIIKDVYVSYPNVMGIVLGGLQFGLFCAYPSRSSSSKTTSLDV
ncbi:sugar transporter SWEET1-like [Haliotis rufescens]|uniref:sugar transporter SWEET1-like n=1 Tax=Haliotis rufescens TaxID=6454 RepID=UPI001EAFEE94|nr:sugar transporter SWEET1-like [Haliotis rufescens]